MSLSQHTVQPERMRPALLMLLGLTLVLGACQGAGGHRAPQDRDAVMWTPTGNIDVIRYDTVDVQIAEHWQRAEFALQQGNDAEALDYLYAGLELAPENAMFWSRAAELQLDNDQLMQAEHFAFRSNNLAGNNVRLLHRNWLIIEHARSLRGDLLGVRSAHRKVQQYQP